MTTDTRNPSQPSRPESAGPRGAGRVGAAAPGASFYASAMTEAEKDRLVEALKVKGVDQEIALIRLRLKRLLAEEPDNAALLFRGVDLLNRAVSTKHRVGKDSPDDLGEAIREVLKGVVDETELEEYYG